ncbi:MAG: ral secretion pathway protein [Patescibacteria group bacterium]|nr:ral secretion pathway protein [Patescibacteria group bacterium]
MVSSRTHFLQGFTLIELLVVISIIGLLSSILLGAISDARRRAFYAKAAIDARTLEIALQLYYEDHADWPNIEVAKTSNTQSWSGAGSLGEMLEPYLPQMPVPGYNSIFGTQEYIYLRGTETSPTINRIMNSADGSFVGCVKVYKGYFIDFYWSGAQSALTLNDGGFDPDGIDKRQGRVELGVSSSECPYVPPTP